MNERRQQTTYSPSNRRCHVESLGFTLLEVMVAICLLGILLALGSSTMVQNLRESLNNERRYEAIQAAQTVLDNMRFEEIEAFTEARHEQVTVGGHSFNVDVTFCELEDFCISAEIAHITVRVRDGTRQIYETDTVFSDL